jgi:hypothetical protein
MPRLLAQATVTERTYPAVPRGSATAGSATTARDLKPLREPKTPQRNQSNLDPSGSATKTTQPASPRNTQPSPHTQSITNHNGSATTAELIPSRKEEAHNKTDLTRRLMTPQLPAPQLPAPQQQQSANESEKNVHTRTNSARSRVTS